MERLCKKIDLKDSSFSTDWHFWITGCSISAMHQRWWWLQLWWWWWRWLRWNCETCTAEALEAGQPPRIQTGQNIRSGRDLEMKNHHQPSTTKAKKIQKYKQKSDRYLASWGEQVQLTARQFCAEKPSNSWFTRNCHRIQIHFSVIEIKMINCGYNWGGERYLTSPTVAFSWASSTDTWRII